MKRLLPALVFLISVFSLAPASDRDASANGRYQDLLLRIDCPEDRETYGEYTDYGHYPPTEWCGVSAPEGYWVYVYPTWYIWKTMAYDYPDPGKAE